MIQGGRQLQEYRTYSLELVRDERAWSRGDEVCFEWDVDVEQPVTYKRGYSERIFVYLPTGSEDWIEPENTIAARLWLRRQRVTWIHPQQGREWRIDGDQLRATFPKLRDLQWLHGRLFVWVEIKKTMGWSTVLSRPSGPLRACFSIHPDSPREPQMIRQMAPHEIHGALSHFHQDNESARATAFVMMRFSRTTAHSNIFRAIQESATSLGCRALRADDRFYHDDLYYNVLTHIYGCDFGIAVFERLETDEFNPNVALEIGYMLALHKPVCILKDRTLKALQTDLVGKLYVGFDPQHPAKSIPKQVTKWIKDKALVDNY